MIRLVIFDMAGTTIDEKNTVYRCMQELLVDAGYDASLEEVLLVGAGKGKLQAFKDVLFQYFPYADSGVAERLHASFLTKLDEAYKKLTPLPFPTVKESLAMLMKKGIGVALSTGYNRKTALSLLQKMAWEKGRDYDFLVCRDDVERSRPEPDMIHLAMKHFGISQPLEVAKIGDSLADIEEGKKANCGLSLGITTGAMNRKQLEQAHPDAIIDRMEELLPLVLPHK